MNAQDPLASLHPLREPPLVDWWPPAPGWWLLLGLALVCLIALVFFLVRRYRASAYRRRALQQLRSLHQQYLTDNDGTIYISRVNALLKSVALVAYPRTEVAANSGESWREFLNRCMKGGEQFPPAFATAAYRPTSPEMDMAQLHLLARSWIRQHEARR